MTRLTQSTLVQYDELNYDASIYCNISAGKMYK